MLFVVITYNVVNLLISLFKGIISNQMIKYYWCLKMQDQIFFNIAYFIVEK